MQDILNQIIQILTRTYRPVSLVPAVCVTVASWDAKCVCSKAMKGNFPDLQTKTLKHKKTSYEMALEIDNKTGGLEGVFYHQGVLYTAEQTVLKL